MQQHEPPQTREESLHTAYSTDPVPHFPTMPKSDVVTTMKNLPRGTHVEILVRPLDKHDMMPVPIHGTIETKATSTTGNNGHAWVDFVPLPVAQQADQVHFAGGKRRVPSGIIKDFDIISVVFGDTVDKCAQHRRQNHVFACAKSMSQGRQSMSQQRASQDGSEKSFDPETTDLFTTTPPAQQTAGQRAAAAIANVASAGTAVASAGMAKAFEAMKQRDEHTPSPDPFQSQMLDMLQNMQRSSAEQNEKVRTMSDEMERQRQQFTLLQAQTQQQQTTAQPPAMSAQPPAQQQQQQMQHAQTTAQPPAMSAQPPSQMQHYQTPAQQALEAAQHHEVYDAAQLPLQQVPLAGLTQQESAVFAQLQAKSKAAPQQPSSNVVPQAASVTFAQTTSQLPMSAMAQYNFMQESNAQVDEARYQNEHNHDERSKEPFSKVWQYVFETKHVKMAFARYGTSEANTYGLQTTTGNASKALYPYVWFEKLSQSLRDSHHHIVAAKRDHSNPVDGTNPVLITFIAEKVEAVWTTWLATFARLLDGQTRTWHAHARTHGIDRELNVIKYFFTNFTNEHLDVDEDDGVDEHRYSIACNLRLADWGVMTHVMNSIVAMIIRSYVPHNEQLFHIEMNGINEMHERRIDYDALITKYILDKESKALCGVFANGLPRTATFKMTSTTSPGNGGGGGKTPTPPTTSEAPKTRFTKSERDKYNKAKKQLQLQQQASLQAYMQSAPAYYAQQGQQQGGPAPQQQHHQHGGQRFMPPGQGQQRPQQQQMQQQGMMPPPSYPGGGGPW